MPRQTFRFTSPPQPSQQDASEAEDPVIAPDEVFRIERPAHPGGRGVSYPFKIIVLLIFFAVLLAGGGFLMHYLSKHPIRVADDPQKNAPPKPVPKRDTPAQKRNEKPPEPTHPAEVEMARNSADQSLADFINAREALDNLGGAQWGGDSYRRMEETGRQGDALYLKKEYGPASGKYQQALAMVRALEVEAPNALVRLMDEGKQALEAGEGKLAGETFALALMIDPSSRGAQRGLARAEKAEALGRLLSSGRKHESRKKFAFALADYQEAVKLDPESLRAREAYQRVKDLIAEDAFRKNMSAGLTALHTGDFDGARAALGRARGLRPDSQEVMEALAQVDQAARLAKMKEHQLEALEAERSEDWDRALGAYQAVLEIDPRVQFAVQGKEGSLEMIRLSKRVAYYLDSPEVLESDKYLDQAAQLLSETEKVAPLGPQLKARVEQLRLLVQSAQIPLKITLESDNLTQVAVYRVGKLGTFLKKDLTLRPGTYTIVGTRSGYKDVRQRVVIKPGQPLRVTIICREKIG